tara:strand:+ start:664 stop:1143 length:480 start_codon:yes stop_codon:yes gene_type:complete
MNKFLNIKGFYFATAILSFFILLSAFYIEYVLGAEVCRLCLYQRIPYLIAIFICFLGYNNSKKIIWIYLLTITFLSSLILSGYHFGIENNIFPEFSGCKTDNLSIINKEDLLNSLNKIMPNCKDITFRIFGLSLATINIFISGFIMTICIVFIKNEKNK